MWLLLVLLLECISHELRKILLLLVEALIHLKLVEFCLQSDFIDSCLVRLCHNLRLYNLNCDRRCSACSSTLVGWADHVHIELSTLRLLGRVSISWPTTPSRGGCASTSACWSA